MAITCLPACSSVASSSHAIRSTVMPGTSSSLDASTRCRYKTGRCTNARVVKPNGSLLLLCEFHRDQQNRTKKRSDMKYRHHRAKKRQLDKRTARAGLLSSPTSTAGASPLRLRNSTTPSVETTDLLPTTTTMPSTIGSTRLSLARPSLECQQQQQLSPIVSTPTTLTSGASVLSSTAALKKAALFKLSSGLRAAHAGSRISPGKARLLDTLRPRDAFTTSRRDIVAMASPASKTSAHDGSVSPQLSPTIVPLCLSPLHHTTSPWAARAAWQPEDVRLLEYFIL